MLKTVICWVLRTYDREYRSLNPLFADQGYEADRYQGFTEHLAPLVFTDKDQMLNAKCAADRDNHLTSGLELLNKGRGNMIRGTGNNNRIERLVLRPAFITVADFQVHGCIAVGL